MLKGLFSKRASGFFVYFFTKLNSILYKSVWVEQDKFYIDLLFSFLTLDIIFIWILWWEVN